VTPCAPSRAVLVALGVIAGAAGGYWYARPPASVPESAASGAERKILYYRDPTGAPFWSAEPKKDASGRDWLPVFEDEEISFEPGGRKPTLSTGGSRKILYYRNPMGLPDTSPVPKKDWMGMDYIPVYEGEEQDDGKTAKVSLDKVQRSGVRTEKVEERIIVRPVRGVGTVTHDESRLTIVAMRSEVTSRSCSSMAGLLPIMWSHGTGAEVMQRIAVPMIGGMVSSTLLTLIVIPSIYAVVKGVALRAGRSAPSVQQA
jgi:AcrB/AcrD/AcrF family